MSPLGRRLWELHSHWEPWQSLFSGRQHTSRFRGGILLLMHWGRDWSRAECASNAAVRSCAFFKRHRHVFGRLAQSVKSVGRPVGTSSAQLCAKSVFGPRSGLRKNKHLLRDKRGPSKPLHVKPFRSLCFGTLTKTTL